MIGVDAWASWYGVLHAIADGYKRQRYMPDDEPGIFDDERNCKRIIYSQSADDELLSLMAVKMREKSTSSALRNCLASEGVSGRIVVRME